MLGQKAHKMLSLTSREMPSTLQGDTSHPPRWLLSRLRKTSAGERGDGPEPVAQLVAKGNSAAAVEVACQLARNEKRYYHVIREFHFGVHAQRSEEWGSTETPAHPCSQQLLFTTDKRWKSPSVRLGGRTDKQNETSPLGRSPLRPKKEMLAPGLAWTDLGDITPRAVRHKTTNRA